MGLRDLIPDDAGDGKGGRPKEEEKEPNRVGPSPGEIETEEFWINLWEDVVTADEPTVEEVAELCDRTFMFPWDVKIKLEAFGIYEFNWRQIPEDYPPDTNLADKLREQGIVNEFTKQHPPSKSKRRKKFGSDDSSSSSGSGLMGLVEDAKD